MVAPDFSCISTIMWFVKCRLPLYRRRPISFGSLLWSHFVLITTKNHNSYILVEAYISRLYLPMFSTRFVHYLLTYTATLSDSHKYVHNSYCVVTLYLQWKVRPLLGHFFKIYFRIIIMHPCLVSENLILLAPIYYIFTGGDTEK